MLAARRYRVACHPQLVNGYDEERDDYPNLYDVDLLPFRSEEEIKANPFYWKDLSSPVHLGQMGVTEIGLDETRRRSLDSGVIGPWLSARMSLPRGDGGSSAPSSLDCVETST